MIIDRLINVQQYYELAPGLKKAFEFLKTTDLEKLEVGKYEIDGEKIVVLVQEYDTNPTPKWESHKYHIDIQYLVSGEEKIGYRPLEGMVPPNPDPYKMTYDCTFYEENYKGDYLTLKDDIFMIFFPKDGHVPRVSVGQPMPVKKVVIKVLI
ncbi:YhcH/YjgK/YiaL family protein [Clostridium sp.]|uniref:YhcH/YjgK/YiaL family protein n=1 Tax=Clostridium sp. TaxID=1506 RepID=UPI003D6C825F